MISIPKSKDELLILTQTNKNKQPSDGVCPICKKKILVGEKLTGRDWFLAHYECTSKLQ